VTITVVHYPRYDRHLQRLHLSISPPATPVGSFSKTFSFGRQEAGDIHASWVSFAAFSLCNRPRKTLRRQGDLQIARLTSEVVDAEYRGSTSTE
jgi:hypothetical protein